MFNSAGTFAVVLLSPPFFAGSISSIVSGVFSAFGSNIGFYCKLWADRLRHTKSPKKELVLL
jgi:hypothetical protein